MTTSVKTCFKCGSIKELSDFYKHPKMADGHLGKCKDCTKADARRVQIESAERIKDYERHRARLPHRRAFVRRYASTTAGKIAHAQAMRRYIYKYPLKRQAHIKVSNALRDGRLTFEPCEICGCHKAHAHHDDYTKPLDVRWLCVAHHAEWHRHNEAFYPEDDARESA